MANDNKRSIFLATWKDVRDEFYSANKELATIIDQLDPDDSYKFINAEYLYGDIPIKDGVVYLPMADGSDLCSIKDNRLAENIVQELSYSHVPLFLVLENSNEVFINVKNHIVPVNLYYKGGICGTYETMDYFLGIPSNNYKWSFSAGSRSIIMLPKITNQLKLAKLCKEYRTSSPVTVKDLTDYWSLFKSIAQSENFSQNWTNKVLYFGGKWFTNKNHSKEWMRFKDYFVRLSWKQAQYSISPQYFSLYWSGYAEAIMTRRLKPKPYILDQLRHILSIARADCPAFKPISNQRAAPVAGLKDAFINSYMLEEYFPTLMHAAFLEDSQSEQSIYYSLSFPTLFEGSPLKKSSSTILFDLKEIQFLIETLQDRIDSQCDIEQEIISKNRFDYFHTDADDVGTIQPSTKVCDEDQRFLQDKELFPERTLCTTSRFFRGCIRIKPVGKAIRDPLDSKV